MWEKNLCVNHKIYSNSQVILTITKKVIAFIITDFFYFL